MEITRTHRAITLSIESGTDRSVEKAVLSNDDVAVLTDYADALDGAATRDWGDNITKQHTTRVRDLASRIATIVSTGAGAVTDSDASLVKSVGDELVLSSTRALADPNTLNERRNDAQHRLRVGNAMLTMSRILRQMGGA